MIKMREHHQGIRETGASSWLALRYSLFKSENLLRRVPTLIENFHVRKKKPYFQGVKKNKKNKGEEIIRGVRSTM
jgi:hypothetical protein